MGISQWSSYTKGMSTGPGHTQEKCRNISQVCKKVIRKVKIQMELKLDKEVKGTKYFCRYISNRRKVGENLVVWTQNLVTKLLKKSVFTG